VQDEVLAISSRSVSRLIGSELTSPNSRPCTAATSEAAQTVDHVERPRGPTVCGWAWVGLAGAGAVVAELAVFEEHRPAAVEHAVVAVVCAVLNNG